MAGRRSRSVSRSGRRRSPESVGHQLDRLCKALEPWSSDSWYFNFADRPTDLEAIFAPNTLVRLREVKREYDPDGLIAGNHNISLA